MKTSRLAAFRQKEFKHILRDKWTLLIIALMPIIQLLLFGYALNTEVRNVKVAVFDPSNDEMTTRIIERVGSSEYFDVTERITDISRINDIFREGKVSLVIAFCDNFSGKAKAAAPGEGASLQLILDGTDPNQSSLINAYMGSILDSYKQELKAQLGQQNVTITPTARMLYNPQNKSSYNFVPGLMGMLLMLICAMMTAISIAKEKERGTMEVLLASPVKPIGIIISKAIPYLVLSIVILAITLLCAVFVMGVPIVGSLATLCLLSVIFLACNLALGLLISTLVNTQMAAMIGSGMGLMMPTILLSGLIFPIESMPAFLQWVSALVPARWFIEACRMVMIQGSPIGLILPQMGILAFMTAVFISLCLIKFKTRLE